MDLWSIVDKSEETPLSNIDAKVKNEHKRRVKKVLSIITLNLIGD